MYKCLVTFVKLLIHLIYTYLIANNAEHTVGMPEAKHTYDRITKCSYILLLLNCVLNKYSFLKKISYSKIFTHENDNLFNASEFYFLLC